MNPYFSRLAQRSGVSPSISVARHGNASSPAGSDWGEQSTETTAPGNALPSTNVVDNTDGSHATTAASFDRINISTQAANPAANPSDSAKAVQRSGNALTPSAPSVISEMPSTGSNFSRYEQTMENASENFSTTVKSVPETRLVSSKTKSVTTFPDPSESWVNTKESNSSGLAPKANADGEASKQAVAMPTTNRGEKTVSPVSGFDRTDTNKADLAPVTRASAVLSNAAGERTEKIERIASSPAQAAVLPVQQTRQAPRPSIEVNIGKIELEVYAPANKAVPQPTPAPVSVPRSIPAPAFNPHRHYLRGR